MLTEIEDHQIKLTWKRIKLNGGKETEAEINK